MRAGEAELASGRELSIGMPPLTPADHPRKKTGIGWPRQVARSDPDEFAPVSAVGPIASPSTGGKALFVALALVPRITEDRG